MKIYEVGKYIVVRGTKHAEPKFRVPLSRLIVETYGQGPYNQETITQILLYCQKYYITEFERICEQEKSYTFYKEIIWLHEQATALRFAEEFSNLPEGLDQSYIGGYRRILKLILEQGCLIDMVSGEKRDDLFKRRIHAGLDELLFLGEMIYQCSESIAEQAMIEDVHDIVFDKNGLYVFERRHHYEFIFKHISKEMEGHKPVYIIDKNGSEDFSRALKDSFEINYEEVKHTIGLIIKHFGLKPGDAISANRESFIKDISNQTGKDNAVIERFLSGLILEKKNKLPIAELVKRPHSLDRYLYRPLLKWKINGKDFFVFGNYSWFEAENSLFLNAIPWGKIPSEWQDNACFNAYVNRKKAEHDKWLDDKVEQIIQFSGLLYQRGIKKIVTKKTSYSLVTKDLGEIDFIILCPAIKKVFVAECKHLIGRYDKVNWKNDYDHFTQDGKKSYNTRLNSKVEWLRVNKKLLEEHFQNKFNKPAICLDEYSIEGIFFVNTPTFYMYNSEYRIYTYDQIQNVITGKHKDPTFTLFVDEEDTGTTYFVQHPYFRMPKLLYYNNEDDNYDVDKYGFPIKK